MLLSFVKWLQLEAGITLWIQRNIFLIFMSLTENYFISFITHRRNTANVSVTCSMPSCRSVYLKEEKLSL